MKKIIILSLLTIVFNILVLNVSAQDKEKSETKSALTTAQEEVIRDILDKEFNNNSAIDHIKVYKEEMTSKIIECLKKDVSVWGNFVTTNASNSIYKSFDLSFDNPKAKFKLPRKAIKSYKKAFKILQSDFFNKRKTKTLDKCYEEKEMKKYITKILKSLESQKSDIFKTLSK